MNLLTWEGNKRHLVAVHGDDLDLIQENLQERLGKARAALQELGLPQLRTRVRVLEEELRLVQESKAHVRARVSHSS